MVCVCVCVGHERESCKAAEPIEVTFGVRSRVAKNLRDRWGPGSPSEEGAIWAVVGLRWHAQSIFSTLFARGHRRCGL